MDKNKNVRAPTEKDFSGGAVQRAVFKETIQHPGTIIPFGISGGFAGLMLLGLMAITPVTLIVPVVSGLIGSGVWVYNYGVRGKDIAGRYIHSLREQIEEARRQEIFTLKQECHDAGFTEGYKEADELEAAYLKFRAYLEKKAQTGQELDSARYQSLAKDIYKEGLKLLRSALEAHKALKEVDIEALRRDKKTYVKQLEKAKTAAESKGLETRIKNHDDRIAVYERHSEIVHQLMTQVEEFEGSLESAYLDVVDLGQGRGLTTSAESVARLERQIQAAKKVEARLLGEDTKAEDQMYLEAGHKSS